MQRTLTRRGLAVVFAGLVGLGLTAIPVSAARSASSPHSGWHPPHHAHHLVIATGTWVDPGAISDHVVPDGDHAVVDMHGGTIAKGGFTGRSSYTMQVDFYPATSLSVGHCRETYAAVLGKHGHGHVTLSEHVKQTGDGDVVVAGPIVAGDGVFRHAHGYAIFKGHQAASNAPSVGTGKYRMWVALAR